MAGVIGLWAIVCGPLVLQFIWEIFFGLISHLFRPLETEKFISISKAQETLCSELLPSLKTHALPSAFKALFCGDPVSHVLTPQISVTCLQIC